MVQKPAAALRSSRLGANSSVRQKRSALSNPTKITRLTSFGLGARLYGFHRRSFSNSRAVPELAASLVKKDHEVWRVLLGLLDINIPSCLSSWIRTPRSAVGVRSSNRMEMVGTSSLVTSQTKGSGTALAGIAARPRKSAALMKHLILMGLPQSGLLRLRSALGFSCRSSWRSSLLLQRRPPKTVLSCGDAIPKTG